MSFVSKLNYTRTLLKRKIYKILKRIVRSIKREDGGMADVGGYKEHMQYHYNEKECSICLCVSFVFSRCMNDIQRKQDREEKKRDSKLYLYFVSYCRIICVCVCMCVCLISCLQDVRYKRNEKRGAKTERKRWMTKEKKKNAACACACMHEHPKRKKGEQQRDKETYEREREGSKTILK